jgi:hypothetical protein
MKLEFTQQIFKNPQISNFTKIHPVATKLLNADRQRVVMSPFTILRAHINRSQIGQSPFRNIQSVLTVYYATCMAAMPLYKLQYTQTLPPPQKKGVTKRMQK